MQKLLHVQKTFEDLESWQKARELSNLVYESFRSSKDFGFRDQICRAAVSAMNNIAEGYERKGDKEFKRFLYISKGSCGEVRSMLVLAKDLGYVSDGEYLNLVDCCNQAIRLIAGLIKVMKD